LNTTFKTFSQPKAVLDQRPSSPPQRVDQFIQLVDDVLRDWLLPMLMNG
jgi:hypothetical protein